MSSMPTKAYENNTLKRVLVDGGYIEGTTYYFFITDHLGSNRVVANASGTSIQNTHYYPFGTAFGESTGQEKQPYKYNGKELDLTHGLNLYDYSARYMDSPIGRFTSVDPLAEKYYSWSPYVYTFNNPLRFTDLTGEEPQDGIWKELLKALNQAGQQVLSSVGLHRDQIQSDHPTVREDASGKRQEFVETIHTVNEGMVSVVPGGEITYKAVAEREITMGDAATAAAEFTPAGKGMKAVSAVAKVAKVADKASDAAKTSGWIKRSIFNSLDPTIQKKAANAIEKGIVAPKGNTGIIKLTETEATRTGYQYKIKILGKGGDTRIYGNPMKNGHIYFDKKMGH